jgi:hypothetical protein
VSWTLGIHKGSLRFFSSINENSRGVEYNQRATVLFADRRVAAHSHIKGLGLQADGTAEESAAGFVGQTSAREVEIK